MTLDQRDPFDLLLLGDPAVTGESDELASEHAAHIRSRVLDGVRASDLVEDDSTAELAEPTPLRTRDADRQGKNRRVAVLVGVIAALVMVGAAWVASREPSHPTNVVCYETKHQESSVVVVADADSLDPDVCQRPWAKLELQTWGVPLGAVPPLTPCVNDAGYLVVFPTDDPEVCAELGFAEFERPGASRDLTESGLQGELDQIFLDVACPEFVETERAVRELLDDRPGWTLELVAGPTQDRPCAGYSTDYEASTVYLVPEPRRR